MTCTTFHSTNYNISQQQNHLNYKNDKIKALKEVLHNDIKACDIKWSLFIAAAQGYRFVSKLKPYPSKFMLNDVLNIDAIHQIISIIPSLPILANKLSQPQCLDDDINDDAVDLLYWALITLNDPYLQTIPRNRYDEILNKVDSIDRGPNPTHIFEVKSRISERKFQQHSMNHSTSYAFHGSKFDSFHSILNYGLQQHLCKQAVFGEGIYLSSEMNVSLLFSSIGTGWNKSMCGEKLSCMAICEFVNHPVHLQCHTKGKIMK